MYVYQLVNALHDAAQGGNEATIDERRPMTPGQSPGREKGGREIRDIKQISTRVMRVLVSRNSIGRIVRPWRRQQQQQKQKRQQKKKMFALQIVWLVRVDAVTDTYE